MNRHRTIPPTLKKRQRTLAHELVQAWAMGDSDDRQQVIDAAASVAKRSACDRGSALAAVALVLCSTPPELCTCQARRALSLRAGRLLSAAAVSANASAGPRLRCSAVAAFSLARCFAGSASGLPLASTSRRKGKQALRETHVIAAKCVCGQVMVNSELGRRLCPASATPEERPTLHRCADRIKARAVRRCGELAKQTAPARGHEKWACAHPFWRWESRRPFSAPAQAGDPRRERTTRCCAAVTGSIAHFAATSTSNNRPATG
jgi:hypothetical protein